MTTTSYIIAWVIYLLATASLNVCLWKLGDSWQQLKLTDAARIFLIIIMITPYFSNADQGRLAPAILISVFEFAFGNFGVALQAATPIFALILIFSASSFIYNLKQKSSTQ